MRIIGLINYDRILNSNRALCWTNQIHNCCDHSFPWSHSLWHVAWHWHYIHNDNHLSSTTRMETSKSGTTTMKIKSMNLWRWHIIIQIVVLLPTEKIKNGLWNINCNQPGMYFYKPNSTQSNFTPVDDPAWKNQKSKSNKALALIKYAATVSNAQLKNFVTIELRCNELLL